MRKFIAIIAALLCTNIQLKSQLLAGVEAVLAQPLMFGEAREEFGLETMKAQPGLRIGIGTYILNSDYIYFSARYSHFFGVNNAAALVVSDQNYDHSFTEGACKITYNNVVPQIGFRRSGAGGWQNIFLFGMGLSWGNIKYDMPEYDPQTMHYFNPPWYRSNRKNKEGEVYGALPGLMFSYGKFYEHELFDVCILLDLHTCLGTFPPLTVALSVGIQAPLSSINFVEK